MNLCWYSLFDYLWSWSWCWNVELKQFKFSEGSIAIRTLHWKYWKISLRNNSLTLRKNLKWWGFFYSHFFLFLSLLVTNKYCPHSRHLFDYEISSSPIHSSSLFTQWYLFSQCRSPYIVFFFGACIEPVPVMVLQYCSRGSLFSVLKSKEIITWPLVIKVTPLS